MVQLSPNESYTVVRFLADHTDTDTHYVQAVVYDSTTHAVIDTLNLTDLGNRWFSKVWKVPSGDTYGTGKHIMIITSVYDDAGYTTRSYRYQDEANEYLVQQRWNPTYMGGSTSLDYNLVKQAVEEVLGTKKEVVIPEFPIAQLLQGIQDIVNKIPKVEIPQQQKVDLMPILFAVTALQKSINSLPPQQVVDLNPVLSNLNGIAITLDQVLRETQNKDLYTAQVAKIRGDLQTLQTQLLSVQTKDNTPDMRAAVQSVLMDLRNAEKEGRKNEYFKKLRAKYNL